MSAAAEVPMTDLTERAVLTLEGDAGTWGEPLRARVTITLQAQPTLHPSWTNHVLLRVGARLQHVIDEELAQFKADWDRDINQPKTGSSS